MTDPRMTHDEAIDLAAGYVLGALEPAEEAAVREHLATCRAAAPGVRGARRRRAGAPGARRDRAGRAAGRACATGSSRLPRRT